MKKIIKFILVFVIVITLGIFNSSKVFAKEDDNPFDNNITEISPQNIGGGGSISIDDSSLIEDIEAHLIKKFNTSNWSLKKSESTEKLLGIKPIEMQSNDFPKSEILTVVKNLNLESSYGGCGPIAMIGMADYFARCLNFNEIMQNPYSSSDRYEQAYEMFSNVKTYEVTDDSTGSKQTFSFPGSCEISFNALMANHGLKNVIVARDLGCIGKKSDKISIIKKQIDKGMPVTTYTLFAGAGDLSSHYVNVYGYELWKGTDANGKEIEHLVFMIRPNWKEALNKKVYMDSDIFLNSISGIIKYEINYDEYIHLYPPTILNGLVNGAGLGEYINQEEQKTVLTTNGDIIKTNRLRCSWIENKQLVLSANRMPHDTAYLELEFEYKVRKADFYLSLWGPYESFKEGSRVSLEYFDTSSETWVSAKTINPLLIPNNQLTPKKYTAFFPSDVKKIRIYVECENADAERNKGRVVLNDLHLYFSDYRAKPNPEHEHIYTDHYIPLINQLHVAYCDCGKVDRQAHAPVMTEEGVICFYCGHHMVDHDHEYNNDYMFNDENTHYSFCECGEAKIEEHTIIVENGYDKCTGCNQVLSEHIHEYSYLEHNQTIHKLQCSCGDIKTEEHTIIVENGYDKCNVCNQSIKEHVHEYNKEYTLNDANTHYSICMCGETKLENHTLIYENGSDKCSVCNQIIGEHVHSYVYLKNNAKEHMLQCFCGDEKSENHDIGFVATGHVVVKCSKCQASVYVDHVYYYINSEDDPNEHYAECACGQRITERHECNEYVIDDDHTHQIVCKCGKSYTYNHVFEYYYDGIDSESHVGHCECGASMRIAHVILEENGVMICLFCRYIPEQ